MDIVERLRFDAVRCEVGFSKGVAKNIEEAAAEIKRLRARALTDDECYELFLFVDSRVRAAQHPKPELVALRERLLPFYKARHKEPFFAGEQSTREATE